jgi:hypothetical protein
VSQQVIEKKSDSLVVVGASAGGIEALSVLVGSLAKDFPAPMVLAQHLDPRRPSHLASILERRSKLPIVTVLEPTQLEGGKVYVVPSNQHVVIHDGSVRLEADHRNRPRPSVDLLLLDRRLREELRGGSRRYPALSPLRGQQNRDSARQESDGWDHHPIEGDPRRRPLIAASTGSSKP